MSRRNVVYEVTSLKVWCIENIGLPTQFWNEFRLPPMLQSISLVQVPSETSVNPNSILYFSSNLIFGLQRNYIYPSI